MKLFEKILIIQYFNFWSNLHFPKIKKKKKKKIILTTPQFRFSELK